MIKNASTKKTLIKERIKTVDNAEKSGLISMAIKPISIILTIIYTPLLLSYLGDEKYGLWATILSIISWINYFDVGIGNGLRNSLTKAITGRDYFHAKKLVSTAYIVLSGISLLILIILLLSIFLLNWKTVFSTKVNVELALAITFVFISINFVLALANTLLYALQLAEKVAIRGCLIQLLNIAGMLLLLQTSKESLVYVSILFGSTTMIVNIFNTINIIKGRSYLKPSVKEFNKKCIPEICNTGIQFFIIQIMCLLMFTVDNLIISHFFGPSAVTPFSIANKVYYTGYSFLAAFLVPYWSGTTSAIEKGDYDWINKSIKKAIHVLFVFIGGSVFFTVFFKQIIFIWLHKQLEFDYGLPILMCVFYILYSILAIECQFINGTGKLKVQLIMYVFLGITNIPLSIIFGVLLGLDSFGVRLATTILVFIATIVLGVNLKTILKSLRYSK